MVDENSKLSRVFLSLGAFVGVIIIGGTVIHLVQSGYMERRPNFPLIGQVACMIGFACIPLYFIWEARQKVLEVVKRRSVQQGASAVLAVLWLGLLIFGTTTQDGRYGGSDSYMSRQTAHLASMACGVSAALLGLNLLRRPKELSFTEQGADAAGYLDADLGNEADTSEYPTLELKAAYLEGFARAKWEAGAANRTKP